MNANILQFHRDGLLRVCSVIDGNPNYNDLLEHKLFGSDWTVFDSSAPFAEKIDAAMSILEDRLRAGKVKTIIPTFSGICCDGNTRNNLREFSFFESVCAGADLKIAAHNYSNCGRIPISQRGPKFEEIVGHILTDARNFYHERESISAGLVHQQILYSTAFLAYAIAFSEQEAVKPAAIVQANDHSPDRVALSMIMKSLGIPRVYLQHAEVAGHFPPLDFEYSVLRNRRSLATYETIGPIPGKAYIIPREKSAFAREMLALRRGEGATVVIYPTSRILIDELRALVEKLDQNPAVRQILIKQHPGAARVQRDLFEASKLKMVADFPREDHIAIVGNSSVVTELLHRGIPVYQNFSFDPIDTDYYGFVKSGLTHTVALQELSDVFWKPYELNENWLATYAEWDSSAGSGYTEQQKEFAAEMTRLAGTAQAQLPRWQLRRRGSFRAQVRGRIKRGVIRAINANPRASALFANIALRNADRTAAFLSLNAYRAARYLSAHTQIEISSPVWRGPKKSTNAASFSDLIEHTLVSVEDPAAWLLLNEGADAIASLAVIDTMEAMFQKRSPSFQKILGRIEKWPSGSATGTWAYLKKIEWGNFEIYPQELDEIARFIYGYSANSAVRRLLEQSLLLLLLRFGTCEQLDSFWQSAISVKKAKLQVNQIAQLLLKLHKTPGRETEADHTLRIFEQQATTFEILKMENMKALGGRRPAGWNHVHAELRFVASAPDRVSRDFIRYVQPTYDALRPRMRFMDVRTDTVAAAGLLSLIRSAIADQTPLSMIRLGDGEGYIFPEGDFFTESDRANRERHWWGTELDKDLRKSIAGEVRQALLSADLVGIPAISRFIRDQSESSKQLLHSVQSRGLVQVLSNVERFLSPKAWLTEDRINMPLFSDPQTIASLARMAAKVAIVGSVRPENLPPMLRELAQLEMIILPTHARTTGNVKYNAGAEPLPLVYEPLLEKLDKAVGPGDLVLVSGGIIGKIFIGHAREKGAVALDVGGVIDDWIISGMRPMR